MGISFYLGNCRHISFFFSLFLIYKSFLLCLLIVARPTTTYPVLVGHT
ncbi:hypothetical protein ACN38_g12339, partial [Penicillium nordicum]